METQFVAFRLSKDLIAQLDAHAESMRRFPDESVTRADALRDLLHRALRSSPIEKSDRRIPRAGRK